MNVHIIARVALGLFILGVAMGGRAPAKPPVPAQLDCPVIPYWCRPLAATPNPDEPTSCVGKFRVSDEYDFVIDPYSKTATWLDMPHISTDIPDIGSEAAIEKANLVFTDNAIAWSNPKGSINSDSHFVLWRDTLRLDVTTRTREGYAYWRGTCTKTSDALFAAGVGTQFSKSTASGSWEPAEANAVGAGLTARSKFAIQAAVMLPLPCYDTRIHMNQSTPWRFFVEQRRAAGLCAGMRYECTIVSDAFRLPISRSIEVNSKGRKWTVPIDPKPPKVAGGPCRKPAT